MKPKNTRVLPWAGRNELQRLASYAMVSATYHPYLYGYLIAPLVQNARLRNIDVETLDSVGPLIRGALTEKRDQQ